MRGGEGGEKMANYDKICAFLFSSFRLKCLCQEGTSKNEHLL